jgi:hypothetical protein
MVEATASIVRLTIHHTQRRLYGDGQANHLRFTTHILTAEHGRISRRSLCDWASGPAAIRKVRQKAAFVDRYSGPAAVSVCTGFLHRIKPLSQHASRGGENP